MHRQKLQQTLKNTSIFRYFFFFLGSDFFYAAQESQKCLKYHKQTSAVSSQSEVFEVIYA